MTTATPTIASISRSKLWNDCPALRTQEQELETEFSPQERELVQLLARCDEAHQVVLAAENKEQCDQATASAEQACVAYQSANESFMQALHQRKAQIAESFANRVRQEVQSYAAEHQIDVVFWEDAMLVNGSQDITGPILERLQVEHS